MKAGNAHAGEPRSPLKIATGPLPRSGGVRTHIRGLTKFSRNAHHVIVEPPWSPFHPVYGGLRTWLLLHPRFPVIDPYVSVTLAARLRSTDVVHTHGHPSWTTLYRALKKWSPRRLHTVHQVYEEGDARNEKERRRLSALNREMFAYCDTADVTIAISRHVQRRLEAEGCTNVLEIPGGVDVTEADRADARRGRERHSLPPTFVATVGHLGAVKAPSMLVELARALSPHALVAVGPGLTGPDLRAAGLAAPENLVLLGGLPHEHLLDVLAAASAFVLTSQRESFSVSALEAMALGVPCVLPDIPGLDEVSGGGKFALLFPPGDVEGARSRVLTAMAEPQFGLAARGACRSNYDWRRVAPRIDGVYESLVR